MQATPAIPCTTSTEQPRRAVCRHCGLPVGSLAYRWAQADQFCCYGCYLAWRIVGEQEQEGAAASLLARLGVAGFLAMNVMMISLLLYYDAFQGIGSQAVHFFRWALLGLSAPVLLILGVPLLCGAAQELRRGLPSLDCLIAVGALAGFGVSAAHVVQGRGHIYFDTATMLLALVTLGKLLEASARSQASRALKRLLELKPPVARVLSEAGEKTISADEVSVGSQVRVLPGERLPVDGIILAGISSVQEATFTGESQPRECAPGDRVYGGTANGEGELLIEATAVGEGTLLAQIGRLVEQAQAQRAPVERLAARVATMFVPSVFAAAVGAVVYWAFRGDTPRGWMSALAVLVVACPCALGLATPLAICVALGRAARQGVLIRAGAVLETFSKVSCMFLDKTGTLTKGQPVLREIACCADASAGEGAALALLASLESASEHPLGRAIVSHAQECRLTLGTVANFRAVPGRGATGLVKLNGVTRQLCAGTLDFLASGGMDVASAAGLGAVAPGHTPVFVAWDGHLQARVSLADALRPDATDAVRELQETGVRVIMLSGDRRSTAERMAHAVGLREVRSECTPEAKIEHVRRQRDNGDVVAMVGDGINDAPALAAADVGIAVGSGTDLAREVSSVTLLGDGLLRVPWALRLARQTYRTIRQNLVWAFGYNLVAMALAFFGYLHPLVAVAAMLCSGLFVLHNSLRLAG